MLNGEQQQRNWVVKKYLKFYVVLIELFFDKVSTSVFAKEIISS